MAEWDDWVGRETRSKAWLDAAQANRMAATLDREPTFTDGDALPAAWHWLFFHDIVPASKLGGDGHPALGVTMPPVPLPRRMWAGGRLEFEAPLVLGEVAERVSRISKITPKEGRSGKLVFVTVDSEVSQGGEVKVRERQDIVYRELTSSGSATPPTAPDGAQFTDTWQVNSTTLFRYSALTFNGHRIHYDVDYARDVEGYDNLVIHGPLIATLLLDAAARNGHDVAGFSYRAKSPLLLPGAFTVNGSVGTDVADGESGETEAKTGTLWAATPEGRLAMDAEIELR